MAQWIEAEQEAYTQLLKAYRVVSPELADVLPSQVRGVLLWRNTNLTPSERATIGTAIAGQWSVENVQKHLRT
eukprot:5547513-Lingulodinium_polyedra.AAC.1